MNTMCLQMAAAWSEDAIEMRHKITINTSNFQKIGQNLNPLSTTSDNIHIY